MSYSVWAYVQGAYRAGNGWDTVVDLPHFTNNLSPLVQTLESSGLRGRVTRLAIVAHGDTPGVVQTVPPMTQVSIFANPEVCGPISSLRDYLEPSAQILLMACMAGAGPQGSSFLQSLSTFWPGRTVVGFITSGEIQSYYFTAGDVFDTGGAFSGGTILHRLPRSELMRRRMTSRSPSAKWARNGAIIRLPQVEKLLP